MRKLLFLMCVLFACSRNRPVSPSQLAQHLAASSSAEFSGLYSAGFEEEAFRPCGSTEQWWVANPDPLRARYAAAGAAPYEPVYAVIRGDTSPRMSAGHLGLYQRYLRIHEVIQLARLDSATLHRHPRVCPDTTKRGSPR